MKLMRIMKYNYAGARDMLNGTKNLSFAEMKEIIEDRGALYGSGLTRAFNDLGYETQEVLADIEPLQKQWAFENRVSFNQTNWSVDIVLAQIQNWRPEILYFQDAHGLPFDVRKLLKTRFPFIKVIVMFKGFPWGLNELEGVDILLCGTPAIRDECKRLGFNAHVLYHGFDRSILDRIDQASVPSRQITYDISFAGSAGVAYTTHRERYWYLLHMLRNTNIHCFLDASLLAAPNSRSRRLKQLAKESLGLVTRPLGFEPQAIIDAIHPRLLLNRFSVSIKESELHDGSESQHQPSVPVKAPNDFRAPPIESLESLYPKQCHPPVFGMEMYRVLNSSKITFNKHTDAAAGLVGNMRLFEATGIGVCLLTDTGGNMADLFVPDVEVVTYGSAEEAVEKVKYLLAHDDERSKIAKAGQQKTLRAHTSMNRAQEVDRYIREKLAIGTKPRTKPEEAILP